MVVIYLETDALAAQLNGMKEDYRAALEEGFARAGRLIVDLFRNTQLSGRTPDDRGLNIRTGNLNQSVKSLTQISGSTITSLVYNEGAQYWEYHQTGTDRLPKRLYLEEAFQDDGAKLYTSEVEMALARLAA